MATVRTNDVETYYERRGSGPPIVFVHGALLDHTQWRSQVESLAGDYTTVAYDVRGHGRTGGSEREAYSIELFADDLDALLSRLDIDRPVLCGLSMGGCIAQVYAAARADRLSGLVLADTFAPRLYDRREWVQRSLLLRAAIAPVRLLGYERVERALVWLHERFSGEGVSGDYEQVQRLRAEGPTMTADEFAKVVRAVASFHETTVEYAAITVPTLVVYGEHEAPFVRRHVPRLSVDIPDASVVEIPDAGHASNLDNPEFFTRTLREFLARVGTETQGTT